jgi:glycine dehydrogenase subunit 1
MSFVPHTQEEINAMLAKLGMDHIHDLFQDIPESIKVNHLPDINSGMNEIEMNHHIDEITKNDQVALSFIGAGAYQHYIPDAVWQIATRGEFYSCYTPYQAEASQGNLQLIYEFQTMMASLCDMEVSNASMYDGASALAESVLMAVRANKKAKSKKILIADWLHPDYVKVIHTMTRYQGIEIEHLPFSFRDGHALMEDMNQYQNKQYAAIVIPQPNFAGQLTLTDQLTDWAHQNGALAIGVVNPIAMALIKPPGKWGTKGADIVCGEGQPLGIPLSSGGPYFGFMTTKDHLIRQLPGRIVGKTKDRDGKDGYVLTLQAREQHIRRSKATSNICTNQGLMVTAATIYMSLLGPKGLKNVALRSHQNTALLANKLEQLPGVSCYYHRNFFNEILVKMPIDTQIILDRLNKKGIEGGYDMRQLSSDWNHLLICCTERHQNQDLDYFLESLNEIIKQD